MRDEGGAHSHVVSSRQRRLRSDAYSSTRSSFATGRSETLTSFSISGHIGSNHTFISFSDSIPSSAREKLEKASHMPMTSFSTSCCEASKRWVNSLHPSARLEVISLRPCSISGDSKSSGSSSRFADLWILLSPAAYPRK